MQDEQHNHGDDAAEDQKGQHDQGEKHRRQEARVGALRLSRVLQVALDELHVARVGLSLGLLFVCFVGVWREVVCFSVRVACD